MRKLIAVSAIALAFPTIAMAQTEPAPAPAPAPAAEPAPAPAPAAEAAPAPAPTDAKTAIAEKVKADWPKYDTGSKGHLTKVELGKWLTDLRVAAGQPAPDAAWQKTAFTQTDKNKDAKISVDELTAFLTSGA